MELRDGAIPMMADRCRWFSRVESIFIITDFIRNTKRELYDEKIEDALEMLDLEWSKDDDTKTQCNRLNTSPLHRGNAH